MKWDTIHELKAEDAIKFRKLVESEPDNYMADRRFIRTLIISMLLCGAFWTGLLLLLKVI